MYGASSPEDASRRHGRRRFRLRRPRPPPEDASPRVAYESSPREDASRRCDQGILALRAPRPEYLEASSPEAFWPEESTLFESLSSLPETFSPRYLEASHPRPETSNHSQSAIIYLA